MKLDLYDGYDWETTRRGIEDKRRDMRLKLQSIRELLASGQQPLDELDSLSSFAFNSIYLGLPEDIDYMSPAELADAIDRELNNTKDVPNDEAWQTCVPEANPSNHNSSTHARRHLVRKAQAGIEIRFVGIDLDYRVPLFPRSADLDASLDLVVGTIEVLDHLPTSTWKTFLRTRPAERSTQKSRPNEPGLSRCQIKWFPTSPSIGSEARLKVI
jgi:autophagy-related protein 2